MFQQIEADACSKGILDSLCRYLPLSVVGRRVGGLQYDASRNESTQIRNLLLSSTDIILRQIYVMELKGLVKLMGECAKQSFLFNAQVQA